MTAADLKAIADIVTDRDLVLISDEAYSELTYEGSHCAAATIGSLRERTITLNGFSKTYAMTGWRIGYLCAPKELSDAALKIHQYVMLCAPVMGRVGALEAIRSAEDEKNDMVNEYRLRRNMFVAGLNRIGLTCHVPEGAFYAFPSVRSTGLSDVEFAERLLKEHRGSPLFPAVSLALVGKTTSGAPMPSPGKRSPRPLEGWRHSSRVCKTHKNVLLSLLCCTNPY